jgi:hypothetical protein
VCSRANSIVLWKPGVDRASQEFGVAEGVADAECQDRILVVPGVTYERPPGAERPAKIIGQTARAAEAFGAGGGAHSLGQPGNELERVQEVALDPATNTAEPVVWPKDDRQHPSVVPGRRDDHPAGTRI